MGIIKRGGTRSTATPGESNDFGSLVPAQFTWNDVGTKFTTRSALVTIYGETDTGRTSLSLTAPSPIAVLHAYEKIDGLVQRVRSEGKIIKEGCFGGVFRGGVDYIQQIAEAQMLNVEFALTDAVKWARSIVVDTEKVLWDVCQLARLGTLTHAERDSKDQRKGQLIYQGINARWSSLFMQYRVRLRQSAEPGSNLILISTTKDEYRTRTDPNTGKEKSSATGKSIFAGQKDTRRMSDVVLVTKRHKERDNNGEYVHRFTAEVEKPWHNEVMRGYEFEGKELDFCYMMGLITDSDPDEWR